MRPFQDAKLRDGLSVGLTWALPCGLTGVFVPVTTNLGGSPGRLVFGASANTWVAMLDGVPLSAAALVAAALDRMLETGGDRACRDAGDMSWLGVRLLDARAVPYGDDPVGAMTNRIARNVRDRVKLDRPFTTDRTALNAQDRNSLDRAFTRLAGMWPDDLRSLSAEVIGDDLDVRRRLGARVGELPLLGALALTVAELREAAEPGFEDLRLT